MVATAVGTDDLWPHAAGPPRACILGRTCSTPRASEQDWPDTTRAGLSLVRPVDPQFRHAISYARVAVCSRRDGISAAARLRHGRTPNPRPYVFSGIHQSLFPSSLAPDGIPAYR